MKINLDDNKLHLRFAPLTLTRPLGNLRMGILCNNERWKMYIPEAEIGFTTEKYLQEKFMQLTDAIQVNASVIPNEEIAAAVFNLEDNSTLFLDKQWIAKRGTGLNKLQFKGEAPIIIKERWDLFLMNEEVLIQDFDLLTNNRKSQKISKTNTLIGDSKFIFIEEGAKLTFATLNATDGPIYIGENAEIMEGSVIRGPFALCEGAGVKLATKVYGATTVGPYSKIGGEVNNSVLFAYSNKGHDGFLGNSVLGEWCNIGADVENGIWACFGARLGCYDVNFVEDYKLENISSFDWFKTYFEEEVLTVCEGGSQKCSRTGVEWDYDKLYDEALRIGDILNDKIGMEICDPTSETSAYFKRVYNNPSRTKDPLATEKTTGWSGH